MYEISEEIHVLDLGVWREATIIGKEEDNFVIHFRNFSAKHDVRLTKGSNKLLLKLS